MKEISELTAKEFQEAVTKINKNKEYRKAYNKKRYAYNKAIQEEYKRRQEEQEEQE